MRRHDKQSGVQRWRCPVCKAMTSARAAQAKSLRLGRGASLAAVARHVLQGQGDIAKRLGMSANGLDAQLDALADLARNRFAVQQPGPSAAADGPWVLHHSGWVITVGRVRQSFRIMNFAPGGAPDSESQPPQAWLDRLLAPAALQPAAAERLLWVAMAWTNGWVQR